MNSNKFDANLTMNVQLCFSFHRVARVSCPLVHWFIGPLIHWSIGPLVHWTSGPLVHWSIGPLNHFPLVHWSIGPLVYWSIGPLVHRSIGPSAHWSIGPLVHWSIVISLDWSLCCFHRRHTRVNTIIKSKNFDTYRATHIFAENRYSGPNLWI